MLNHFLAVADDYEVHERQQPFSLGQQRAIAASLNTLVFRTHLPEPGSGGSGARGGQPGALGRDHRMLQTAAPLLHRCAAWGKCDGRGRQEACLQPAVPAGPPQVLGSATVSSCRALYDRDSRRQFCPPSLWLEPYQHLAAAAGQQQQPVSGAAVVRALLAAGDDEAGEGPAHPGTPGSPAAAGQAAAAAASRPAAVAAILTAAPQCVPFDERVAVFRALIDMDKLR